MAVRSRHIQGKSRALKNLCLAMILLWFAKPLLAQRQMEWLDRGLVAVRQDDRQIFVSWRMLGTDPENIAFNVYRKVDVGEPMKLNGQPITEATCFVDDEAGSKGKQQYFVRAVLDGKEQAASRWVSRLAKPYLSIPLKTPTGYQPNDASVGDLDGDGAV